MKWVRFAYVFFREGWIVPIWRFLSGRRVGDVMGVDAVELFEGSRHMFGSSLMQALVKLHMIGSGFVSWAR